MAPATFLANLLIIIIFSVGGFGLMRWLQSVPAPVTVTVASTRAGAVVLDRQSDCLGFNRSLDEEIARQDRIGQTNSSVRLATLKRDCAAAAQDDHRTPPR